MRKQTIIEYLQKNCICDPNTHIDEPKRSVCGMVCKSQWHWSEEIYRTQLEFRLPQRFNPTEL